MPESENELPIRMFFTVSVTHLKLLAATQMSRHERDLRRRLAQGPGRLFYAHSQVILRGSM